ncbi:hypothetical protein BC830DRAFT_924794 [Chytriomyces sp. MP71]|nr:hypothetical protein BC830DRAFT_924794 [Chytriomyces sp. MP71]
MNNSENDHETASRIAAVLINKGLKVSPPRFTPTSAAYNNKVELQMDSIRSPADEEDALSTAAVFVPILSNGFEGSPQLREDLFYAHKEQRIIVPVLMVKDTRLTWSAILTCGLGSQGTSIREALYNTTVATASISREPIDLSNWVDGDDKLWNLAMDMLVERVTSLAQSVAGSPSSLRASKMPLESTTSSSSSIDSASPATSRPSSVIYSAQRKPRLSILRPRSSIWNLSQGNIASAPSSYNGLRKDKLRGFPLLKKYLRPTLICADEELDTLYAKLDPNTRGWLLNNVAKWMGEVDNPEEDAVLWILGENGTGKSVAAAALIKHLPALLPDTRIAWTVARRDVATDAGSLLNNLVYKLSESWSEYTKALLETERKKGPEVFNNICNATLPQRLRLLLSDPLLAAVSSTPEETSVLFVIEGLEHFEDEEGMLDFVMVLKEEMRVLPPNVKWLFISEATQEVHDALVHLNPAHIELEGVLQRKDLMKWHRSLITPILVPDWEGENEDLDEAVYALTSRSGNSFLYTRFALAPIHISGVRFRGPKFVTAALETFPLDVDSTLLGLLTYLHAEATPADISLFRAVFGTLMFLKAPLSIPALAAFSACF